MRSWRRRGWDVGTLWIRVAASLRATRIVRGDESRRRRGDDVDGPSRDGIGRRYHAGQGADPTGLLSYARPRRMRVRAKSSDDPASRMFPRVRRRRSVAAIRLRGITPSPRRYSNAKGIVIQAYSPLASGAVVDDADVQDIASKIGKSPAQVGLRYVYQNREGTPSIVGQAEDPAYLAEDVRSRSGHSADESRRRRVL